MRVVVIDPAYKTNYLHDNVVFCALHNIFKLIQGDSNTHSNGFTLMLTHATFELYCTVVILKRLHQLVPKCEQQCTILCACVSIAYKLLTDDDCIQLLYTQLYNYVCRLFVGQSKMRVLECTPTVVADAEWNIVATVRWDFFPITKDSYEYYSSRQKTIDSCSMVADKDLYELLNIIEH